MPPPGRVCQRASLWQQESVQQSQAQARHAPHLTILALIRVMSRDANSLANSHISQQHRLLAHLRAAIASRCGCVLDGRTHNGSGAIHVLALWQSMEAGSDAHQRARRTQSSKSNRACLDLQVRTSAEGRRVNADRTVAVQVSILIYTRHRARTGSEVYTH